MILLYQFSDLHLEYFYTSGEVLNLGTSKFRVGTDVTLRSLNN